MLSWGVSVVVRFYWLAACDCHQCCVGIFHDALRVEVREGALRQLAGLHGCLLFSEPSRHSAIKGKTETAASAINPKTFLKIFLPHVWWKLCFSSFADSIFVYIFSYTHAFRYRWWVLQSSLRSWSRKSMRKIIEMWRLYGVKAPQVKNRKEKKIPTPNTFFMVPLIKNVLVLN